MSSKYILGTLAIAGGVYYYDRNVKPIIPRNRAMIDHDVDGVKKFSSDVSKEINERIEEQRKQMKDHPSFSEQLKDLKDTKLYQNISHKTDQYKDAVDEASASEKDKNILKSGVHKYIDTVNSIGDLNKTTTNISTVSPDKEVKEKSWGAWLRGDKSEAEKKLDEATEKAEATKKEWLNWGSKKADEAADGLDKTQQDLERKKNEWFNWGSKKSDEAKSEAERLRNSAENKADDWTSWGSKKADEASKDISAQYEQSKSSLEETKKALGDRFEVEKQRAIDNFERARTNLEDLTNKLLRSAEPDKNEKLEKARSDFQSSLNHLKSYGSDVYNEASTKIKDLYK